MARLARSLIDDEYADDSPWVERAQELFFDQRDYWEDQSISRMIGGLIGNDLGQMRVQFNVRTYVVEPVYRDDNSGLWNFEDPGQPGPEDEDIIMQSARLTEGEESQRERIDQEESGVAREEQVKLVAPNKEAESLEEEPLSPPKLYDEWDYLISRDRPAWCTLVEKATDEGDADEIEEILDRHHNLVNRIKTLVKSVQVQRPVRLKKGWKESTSIWMPASMPLLICAVEFNLIRGSTKALAGSSETCRYSYCWIYRNPPTM